MMERLMARYDPLPQRPNEATKVIARLKATAPGAPMRTIPDGTVGGLYVQWGAKGQPSWMLAYRPGGVQTRVKLGFAWTKPDEPPPGWLTVPAARAEAHQRKEAARKGEVIDKPVRAPASPVAPKSVLLEDAIQRYLDAKQPKSRARVERMLATNLGALMSRPLTSITRTDTRSAIDAIKAPVVANRVYESLRAVFKWCQGREMIAAIPLDPEPPSEESARTRVLTDSELAKVWHAAGSLSLPLRGVVHTLALTGARRSEVSEMRWQDLDLALADNREGATWTLPAPKNGVPHVIPLTAPVLEIIRGQLRVEGSPWVFTMDGKRPVSCSKLGGYIQGLTGLQDVVVHDIRRTMRTGLPRLGVSPDIAERVIGHVITGIRSVYDRHAYLDEKRDALERWAAHVAKITN
jgi:integrase